MVVFRVWFMCLLVWGSYVCKLVCLSLGWGYVYYWICLFWGWWIGDCLSLTLGMVSELDFFITNLNQYDGY